MDEVDGSVRRRGAWRRRAGPAWMRVVLAVCVLPLAFTRPTAQADVERQTGLTAVPRIAHAYAAVLNAEFDHLPELLADTCGPAPPVACLGLEGLATWWEIQLDPESRRLDARFSSQIESAIREATAWTRRDPGRAEAWFYLGAALGTRAQWRVLREDRLAAARDGKRIKEALERALTIDPAMHDAEFGIGVYRYYAAVAPAYLRWLRWLFLLPGGNRAEGLAQMEHARREGQLVTDEAAYQLHVVYLWYERRYLDALDIIVDLEARYPRNPLFRQIEARIRDVYLHDPAGSLAASRALLEAAQRGSVNRASLAEVRARLNIAVQWDHLGDRTRARQALDALLRDAPVAPVDAVRRARALQRSWMLR